MTSNRSYRDSLPQDVVRSEIEKHIGSQFDETIAKKMLEIIDVEDADGQRQSVFEAVLKDLFRAAV